MDFASIRIITHDVERLTRFYETVTGTTAARPAPVFAEIRTGTGVIAIGSTATVTMLGDHAPMPGSNDSLIIEFLVTDVDADFARLRAALEDVVLDRPPCRGETGRRCSAILMETSSTCSRARPTELDHLFDLGRSSLQRNHSACPIADPSPGHKSGVLGIEQDLHSSSPATSLHADGRGRARSAYGCSQLARPMLRVLHWPSQAVDDQVLLVLLWPPQAVDDQVLLYCCIRLLLLDGPVLLVLLWPPQAVDDQVLLYCCIRLLLLDGPVLLWPSQAVDDQVLLQRCFPQRGNYSYFERGNFRSLFLARKNIATL